MPGLVACGRRWDIGSDDLVFPAFGVLVVRVAWLVLLAVVLGLHGGLTCNQGTVLEVYYIGMLVILSLHILVDVLLIRSSMKGTILEATPRRHAPILLYLKFTLFLPELAWTFMGTVWAFDKSSDCDSIVVNTVKGVVIAGWVFFFSIIISLIVLFDTRGKRATQLGHTVDLEESSASKRLWELRCRVLCCCTTGDDNSRQAFTDVAQLITGFFKGLDVVATDIAAGLILLRIEQKKQPRRMHFSPLTYITTPSPHQPNTTILNMQPSEAHGETLLSAPPPTPTLSYPSPTDWMNVPLATHYAKFALGSYGWPLFMFGNLMSGMCKLCKTCRCCACAKQSSYIADDNCCNCNTSAILQTTGILEEDIVYASFFNRIYEIPFYVALDHQHQAVVVSIRGTLSLQDALTDMTADSETLEVEGVEDALAHKGILQAARFIQNTLSNMQLLHTAFRKATGYRLVITGHSLGAGAAAVLAILLRPSYPNLACFAYSPPGWLVSKSLARYSEGFVCSIVLGDDLVPRLGMITMEKLKVHILKCVRDSTLPKYRILAGGCWYTLVGYPDLVDDEETQSRSSTDPIILDSPPVRSYSEQTRAEQTLEEAINASHVAQRTFPPLFLPGHIIYIQEREPAKSCLATPTYQSAWARAEVFDEIHVSHKMVADHMPDQVYKALLQLTENGAAPRHVAQLTAPLGP